MSSGNSIYNNCNAMSSGNSIYNNCNSMSSGNSIYNDCNAMSSTIFDSCSDILQFLARELISG